VLAFPWGWICVYFLVKMRDVDRAGRNRPAPAFEGIRTKFSSSDHDRRNPRPRDCSPGLVQTDRTRVADRGSPVSSSAGLLATTAVESPRPDRGRRGNRAARPLISRFPRLAARPHGGHRPQHPPSRAYEMLFWPKFPSRVPSTRPGARQAVQHRQSSRFSQRILTRLQAAGAAKRPRAESS